MLRAVIALVAERFIYKARYKTKFNKLWSHHNYEENLIIPYIPLALVQIVEVLSCHLQAIILLKYSITQVMDTGYEKWRCWGDMKWKVLWSKKLNTAKWSTLLSSA